MNNTGYYYFPDLLPALAQLWVTDAARAEEVIRQCIEDTTRRKLFLSRSILEQALEQLKNGEPLSYIGRPSIAEVTSELPRGRAAETRESQPSRPEVQAARVGAKRPIRGRRP